eukprot:TRINITY_DN14695_c0_g1_i1.p1 TRINITY_DN14695_c0_g1~~TRINITY_DN14695_c0_g1_i1.p1  ORF type:complete len:749 (+),score=103.18 TRINITY_DN14695_c0_g1_i1:81-2327(+)
MNPAAKKLRISLQQSDLPVESDLLAAVVNLDCKRVSFILKSPSFRKTAVHLPIVDELIASPIYDECRHGEVLNELLELYFPSSVTIALMADKGLVRSLIACLSVSRGPFSQPQSQALLYEACSVLKNCCHLSRLIASSDAQDVALTRSMSTALVKVWVISEPTVPNALDLLIPYLQPRKNRSLIASIATGQFAAWASLLEPWDIPFAENHFLFHMSASPCLAQFIQDYVSRYGVPEILSSGTLLVETKLNRPDVWPLLLQFVNVDSCLENILNATTDDELVLKCVQLFPERLCNFRFASRRVAGVVVSNVHIVVAAMRHLARLLQYPFKLDPQSFPFDNVLLENAVTVSDIEVLHQRGADLNLRNSEGLCPLHKFVLRAELFSDRDWMRLLQLPFDFSARSNVMNETAVCLMNRWGLGSRQRVKFDALVSRRVMETPWSSIAPAFEVQLPHTGVIMSLCAYNRASVVADTWLVDCTNQTLRPMEGSHFAPCDERFVIWKVLRPSNVTLPPFSMFGKIFFCSNDLLYVDTSMAAAQLMYSNGTIAVSFDTNFDVVCGNQNVFVGLQSALPRLTVVQLTDLHVSRYTVELQRGCHSMAIADGSSFIVLACDNEVVSVDQTTGCVHAVLKLPERVQKVFAWYSGGLCCAAVYNAWLLIRPCTLQVVARLALPPQCLHALLLPSGLAVMAKGGVVVVSKRLDLRFDWRLHAEVDTRLHEMSRLVYHPRGLFGVLPMELKNVIMQFVCDEGMG